MTMIRGLGLLLLVLSLLLASAAGCRFRPPAGAGSVGRTTRGAGSVGRSTGGLSKLPRLKFPLLMPKLERVPGVGEAGKGKLPIPLPAGHLQRDWSAVHKALLVPLPDHVPLSLRQARAALQPEVLVLVNLKLLRDALHGPLSEGPVLEEALARVQTLHGKDGLVDRLRLFLAIRAHLGGNPTLARRLSASVGGEALSADRLLRDLKAVGAKAEAASPHASDPIAESVLGPLLVPEGTSVSFHPSVRESLAADLPAIEQTELRVRKALQAEIEAAALGQERRFHIHSSAVQHTLQALSRQLATDGMGKDDDLSPLEARLSQPLRPADRLLARQLLRCKSLDETTTILRQLNRK
jgi:hypothetical protein